MDIKQISMSKGQNLNFMDQVHPSMTEKCAKYVKKSRGPTNIFKNLDGRTPIQFVEDAFKPLQQYKDKIAVVIDGSTTRGFQQPSQASLYAQHLGLKPDQAFDMVEACNGFARALETGYMMYLTKPELKDKYILIINNEMPPDTRGILPEDEKNYKQVASYYVGLTFSHVCTCTLLEKSSNHSWRFNHYTKTTVATNITIPLPYIAKGFEPYCEHFTTDLNDCYGQFCMPSFHDLETKALFILTIILKNQDFFKKANVITHTFSRYVYERFLENADIRQLGLYYNEVGNLGSCSMPWIIHDQYGGQGIPQGQNIAFVGNAAGGSNVMVQFTHQDKNSPDYVPTTEIDIMNKYMVMARIGLRQKFQQWTGTFQKYKTISWQNSDHEKDEKEQAKKYIVKQKKATQVHKS